MGNSEKGKGDIAKLVMKLEVAEKAIAKHLATINPKDLKGKALEYTELWMTLDTGKGIYIRYSELAELCMVSFGTVRSWSAKLKWTDLDKLLRQRNELKVAIEGKPIPLLTEVNLNETAVKTREQEDIVTQVEEATKQAENTAFTNLAANLKETTVLSLSLLKDSLIYAYKMSTFYVRQIELVIESAGGMERLTPKHSETIMEYEKKVNKYLEGVKYAINPNSIFNNLKMLGYSSDLLRANEDTKVMTPDYIQKMLLEMVQGEGMRKYTQKPFEQMIEETEYADMELPSIDGRANKQTPTDARINKT